MDNDWSDTQNHKYGYHLDSRECNWHKLVVLVDTIYLQGLPLFDGDFRQHILMRKNVILVTIFNTLLHMVTLKLLILLAPR